MWQRYETCVFYKPDNYIITKDVFFFDMDGTLIATQTGKVVNSEPNDVVFLGPVPEQLNDLRKLGFMIVIVSNQARYNDKIQAKFDLVVQELIRINGWAPYVFIATANDGYRKPGTKMASLFLSQIGMTDAELNSKSMCGDAVGPNDPFPPYRWDNVDSEFAKAIGARFYRPSEIFGSNAATPAPHQELVIMVGNPASGKTTSAAILATYGYTAVAQDVYKTAQRVYKVADQELTAGKSVVIDATNPTVEKRSYWIELARSHNVPVRIMWHIRDGRPFNALRPTPVPNVAYNIYSSKFESPYQDGVPVVLIY
jgi:bifunctional polynucleotide phosphatase/kinase